MLSPLPRLLKKADVEVWVATSARDGGVEVRHRHQADMRDLVRVCRHVLAAKQLLVVVDISNLARDRHALLVGCPLLPKERQGFVGRLADPHMQEGTGDHHAGPALAGLAVNSHGILLMGVQVALNGGAEATYEIKGAGIVVVEGEAFALCGGSRGG